MDPRLLSYYEQELSFIRESGAEFAQRYKKVARRLSLEGISEANECPDPYVERLLEGFAFLAARVQLKIDSRYPELTHHLLEMVNPSFLAPTPSCTVVELLPDLTSGTLLAGVRVPRGSVLHAARGAAARTDCEFRTAHDVTLWPLEVIESAYLPTRGAAAALGAGGNDNRVRAGIRLRVKAPAGIPLASLPIEHLDFFINATDSLAARAHEQLLANGIGVAAVDGKSVTFGATIHALGFDDSEALLPDTGRNSSAHRLLQEYFALPQRFLFFRIAGLGPALRKATGEALDLVILLDRPDPNLEGRLKGEQFRLHSTPAINLFPRALDRLRLDAAHTEQRLLPDRNRALDFEIYRVETVRGLEPGVTKTLDVLPIYSTTHISGANPQQPFFVTQRRPNVVVDTDEQRNVRSHYIGTETYISVLGLGSADGEPRVTDLDIDALCTNRDLPLLLTLSGRDDDFTLQGAAPLRGVRALTRLTEPRLSPVFADSRKRPQTAWRLVSHLAANHLSLCDRDPAVGAELLREILTLYISLDDKIHEQQVNGVRSVEYQPVFRRIPGEGPIAYGRGLAISLKLDDSAFEGAGILPLASVLERFFSRYVSLNSFTQTTLVSVQRGEIKRWLARSGTVALV
jgi:type VI secretion system protein ImpG